MPTGRLVGVQRRDELVTNDRRRVTEGMLGHGLGRRETAITSAPLVPHFEQPIRLPTASSVADDPHRRAVDLRRTMPRDGSAAAHHEIERCPRLLPGPDHPRFAVQCATDAPPNTRLGQLERLKTAGQGKFSFAASVRDSVSRGSRGRVVSDHVVFMCRAALWLERGQVPLERSRESGQIGLQHARSSGGDTMSKHRTPRSISLMNDSARHKHLRALRLSLLLLRASAPAGL
jgi:hypothetical protein